VFCAALHKIALLGLASPKGFHSRADYCYLLDISCMQALKNNYEWQNNYVTLFCLARGICENVKFLVEICGSFLF
jgi:hypothetical protein